MDLVNRLKHFLEAGNITISQFADSCAIPRPTMTQILKGRNAKISDKLIAKIHEAYPSLSVLWLMFGEGPMVAKSNMSTSQPDIASEKPSLSSQTPEQQSFANEQSRFGNVRNYDPDKFGNHPEAPTDLSGQSPQRVPKEYQPQKRSNSSIEFGTDISSPYSENTSREINPENPQSEIASSSPSSSPSPIHPSPIHMVQDEAPTPYYTSKQRRPATNDSAKLEPVPEESAADSTLPIDIPVDLSKTITNIVVFYSDNSFQSFRPC